jgi:hypothetical protein
LILIDQFEFWRMQLCKFPIGILNEGMFL